MSNPFLPLKKWLIDELESYQSDNLWDMQQAYGLALVSFGGALLVLTWLATHAFDVYRLIINLVFLGGFGAVYGLIRQHKLLSAANLLLLLLVLLAILNLSPFVSGAILLYAIILAATYLSLGMLLGLTLIIVTLSVLFGGLVQAGFGETMIYTWGIFLWVAITSWVVFQRLKQVAYRYTDYLQSQQTKRDLEQQLLIQQADTQNAFDLLEQLHRLATQVENLEDFIAQTLQFLQREFEAEQIAIFRYQPNTRQLSVIQHVPAHLKPVNQQRLHEAIAAKRLILSPPFNIMVSPGLYLTITLPLLSRGEVIAVLDIQGTVSAKFNQTRGQVVEALAQQFAKEIGYRQTLLEMQAALNQVEELNRRLVQENWDQTLAGKTVTGYAYIEQQSKPTDHDWLAGMSEAIIQPKTSVELRPTATGEVALPLKLRGEVIGVLGLHRESNQPWTEDELVALQTISEQISLALESARLFEDTQRNAWRDQMISETTAKVWASNQIEQVMQAAVAQLAGKLGASEVTLQLQPRLSENNAQEVVS